MVIALYTVLALLLLGAIFFGGVFILSAVETKRNMALLGPEAPFLSQDGFYFRDLNKNGRLDPYEDPRRPIDERVEDLLAQMSIEEKSGLMFHAMLGINPDGTISENMGGKNPNKTSRVVAAQLINHFNIMEVPAPKLLAEWSNRVQKLAERTRLGIPVTLSTDPRHSFSSNFGANFSAGCFSQWPEPPGLAAVRDENLVFDFADIARQEYLAAGIRVALHPMADLSTEPRWCRINGTFGEDAELVSKLVKAYIRGFQGEHLDSKSVACMTKHFPGGGPQKDGEDPHFSYGKEQVYPGDQFNYHLKPFEAAFEAGTSQIMPYYGVPMGTKYEQKGFAFNKGVITDLLRGHYGFDGIVCSDWMLLKGFKFFGWLLIEAKAWGVEELTVSERALTAIEAGIDQFGGETCVEVVVDLVKSGKLSEERVDQSARRILREKFRLGLFDDPFLDPNKAEAVIGSPEFCAAGELAQRRSIVLLKNDLGFLPLLGRPKIYVENISKVTAAHYGEVVEKLSDAHYAILRLKSPYEKRKGLLESLFHSGDLDFKGKEKDHILEVLQTVPTIVDIYLERPAVIPEIAEHCAGLIANFGANDNAILDIIFGRHIPCGKLPFELPSSMEAVRKQKEDVPYDSEYPLYPYGYGLTYNLREPL